MARGEGKEREAEVNYVAVILSEETQGIANGTEARHFFLMKLLQLNTCIWFKAHSQITSRIINFGISIKKST